ncbi:MAG TPA: transcription-repair coupling factor, partial [Leeuwenhoekiella sp.]|nr:transcription-repair coupling factor [Leeuwenhoekiella sp.]
MGKTTITKPFLESAQLQELGNAIAVSQNRINLDGLIGSSLSIAIAESFKTADKPFLVILNDKEEATYILNDLEQLVKEDHVLFYPGSYRRPYQIEGTDNANILLRAEVLNRINSRKKPALIITYPDALFEKVVTRKELDKSTLKVKINDNLSLDFVNEMLFEYKFKRVDFVT